MPNVSPRGIWANVGGVSKTMLRGFVGTGGEPLEIDRLWRVENGDWEIVWARSIDSPTSVTVVYGTDKRVRVTWTIPADVFASEVEIRRPDGSLAGTVPFSAGEFYDDVPRPVFGSYTVRGKLGSTLATTATKSNTIDLNLNVLNLSYSIGARGSDDQALYLNWQLPPLLPERWRVYRWLLEGPQSGFDYVRTLNATDTSMVITEPATAGRSSLWIFVAVVGGTTAPFDPTKLDTRSGIVVHVPARPVQNLTTFPFGPSSLKVMWDAPAGLNSGYLLFTPQNNQTWEVGSNKEAIIPRVSGANSTTAVVVALSPWGNSDYRSATLIHFTAAEMQHPTNLSAAATSSLGEMRLSWIAPTTWPDPDAPVTFQVQGSNDGVIWFDTDVVSEGQPMVSYYTFTGTTGIRWMRVRSRQLDNYSLWSTASTTPLWDVVAPNPATITSFKPEGSYGRLVIRGNTPTSEQTRYEVLYQVNGGPLQSAFAWDSLVPAGSPVANVVYTAKPGDVVSARIDVFDAAGNPRYGSWVTYTVAASPTVVPAVWSRSWRATSGGEWDARDDKDVYQGSSADSGGQYRGCWGYSALPAAFAAQSTLATQKTVTGATILIHRRGCGINQADALNLGVHTETADPGDGLDSSPPTITANAVTPETVVFEQQREVALTAAQIAALAAGTGKGVGTYPVTSPYLCLYGVDDDPDSGRITISHLG